MTLCVSGYAGMNSSIGIGIDCTLRGIDVVDHSIVVVGYVWVGYWKEEECVHSKEIESALVRQIQRKLEFYEILYHGKRKYLCVYILFSSIIFLPDMGAASVSIVSSGGCVFHSHSIPARLYGCFINNSITMNPYSGFIDLFTRRTGDVNVNIDGGNWPD